MSLSCVSPLIHRLLSLNTCYRAAWLMDGWIHSWGISDKEGQLWNYIQIFNCIEALLFSCSVVSDSLWPHGLQHASLPYPLPFLELAQIHVHWVGDVIQTFCPLSSPSLLTLNVSQQQGFFVFVFVFFNSGSALLYQVARILQVQLQHQFFQWIFRIYIF